MLLYFSMHRFKTGYLGLLLLCVACTQAAPEPMNNVQKNSDENLPQETNEGLAALNNYMAKLMYKNQWDGPLSQQCPGGQGFYRVRSEHNNGREDRLWEFYCRSVVQCASATCTTTSYINNFRDVISFMCPKNKYMAGVHSYHDNGKEDRRWRFTCCSAPSYVTRECRLTGFVNNFDHPMNFIASAGEVITGVNSYYSAGHR